MIQAMGAAVTMITKKLGEGHPNVVDVINERKVDGVVNTVTQVTSVLRDGVAIRRAAVERHIHCFVALDTARAVVESLLLGVGAHSIKRTDEYLHGP